VEVERKKAEEMKRLAEEMKVARADERIVMVSSHLGWPPKRRHH
jgi:hypothetical protein